MWEKNLNQRVIIILCVVIFGIAMIWIPGVYGPEDRLRPGLDIAGGVSLIFEIDESGVTGTAKANLAEDMKALLAKRVDPQGVYGLVWRVHGTNRLEVQMPLPPPGATEARRKYADALEDLFTENVSRGAVESAFALQGAQREQVLNDLTKGISGRLELLHAVEDARAKYETALDAYRHGRQPESQPTTDEATSQPATQPTKLELEEALDDAEADLNDAYRDFLATNLDRDRFEDVLEMDPRSAARRELIQKFKTDYPRLSSKIDNVIASYSNWKANAGYLDGPADLQRLLRGSGVLEFRILAPPAPDNPARYERYREQLANSGPSARPGDEFGWFKVDNPLAFFHLNTANELANFTPESFNSYVVAKLNDDFYVLAYLSPDYGLLQEEKNWQLRNAMLDRDEHGQWCVAFELDVPGAAQFADLTGQHINEPLCILVDDIAYSAPNIRTKISQRGQITGDFSLDKATYLAQTMQAGSLPARLKETPISERTIGSSLGATNRDKAFRAGIIGLIVVAAFMAVYYLVSGVIADAALILNIVLVLAIMAMLQARFSLAGIAGVILTIGMSVDANVLIFERMREEKERGSSLRLILKNGYEKAFSTIIDANITTLLTCVILYYVGSEEIKGFGLTLGWGIVISLFTALFVTRTVFAVLLRMGLLKDAPMLKFIGVPKIDWYAKRKFFIPVSVVLVLLGLFGAYEAGSDAFDVEFRGGINAEIEVKPTAAGQEPLTDVSIANALKAAGGEISSEAKRLADATVTPAAGRINAFQISVPDVHAEMIAAMLTEPLEDDNQFKISRGGVERERGTDHIIAQFQNEVTADGLQQWVHAQAGNAATSGDEISLASVNSVVEAGFEDQPGKYWNITTTCKNRRLVQRALERAVGDRLQRQQQIDYVFHGDSRGRPYPVTGPNLQSVLTNVELPATVANEPVSEYLDGAAMYFTNLDPPQSVNPDVAGSLPDRLRNMRLQPGFQDYPWRPFRVIGVQAAGGTDDKGTPLYNSVVVLVADDNLRYSVDEEVWYDGLASKELSLAQTTMDTEQALRKVSQFKPQIANRSKTQASLALLLSWVMIIGYLWIRFGRPMYGIAGVVALVHDVCIALAFVAIARFIGGTNHPIGAALLIDDFKINMTIVAAFLTIIGYSINDTIVVFDRIRETRGRLGQVTPEIINDSINQCMSRTLLTSGTTLIILLIMYIWGGSSIRGFNYCMMIGVLTGTYSSIAIASPLLLLGTKRRLATAAART